MDRREFLQTTAAGTMAAVVTSDNDIFAQRSRRGSNDWAQWRGPNRNNVADDGKVPIEWNETKNIIWKSPVPGRGHSSPIVVGGRIFLTTADEQQSTQSVLGYDRQTGNQLWKRDLHQGGFDPKSHRKNTHASSTLACDGQRVFAVFLNGNQIWTTALDLDGKQLWQKKLGGFTSHWGYSASPTLYKSLLIVAVDNKGQGYLSAVDRATGAVRWRVPRPAAPTYASPIVFNVAGRDQLLIAGANRVSSYDPNTGKAIWSAKGTSTECVGTMVVQDDLVFASGGYPSKETLCIRGDGSGKVVWRVRAGDFVPSLLIHNGHLYTVLDNGVGYCWRAETGEQAWSARVSGKFSSSPVLANGHIYVVRESGTTVVFKANPQKYEVASVNQLGTGGFADPVICGGRIYLRIVDNRGGWRENLYCIGEQS